MFFIGREKNYLTKININITLNKECWKFQKILKVKRMTNDTETKFLN